MLIVLSGGGTAGHINPALALADELGKRGCDVRFAGTSFFRTSLAGVDLTACQLADIVLSDAMGELSGCTMDLYQAAGIAQRLGVVIAD